MATGRASSGRHSPTGRPEETPMRATELEFRLRFFFIMGIFGAGFACYALDPVTMSVMLADHLVRPLAALGVHDERHVVQAILGLGAALAFLAALVRTWAAAYLQSDVVHDWNLRAEGLVADGPFRYVRNPLYLGGVLVGAGFGLVASRLGFVVILCGLTMFYYRLILREEALLSETQGEAYRRFLQAVPRLVPSLKPQVHSGGLAPRWGQAFAGETFMWFFSVALAIFAATLNQRLLMIMAICGVAASVLAKTLLRRWSRAPYNKKITS
jgi:protein-S-isoprenylcysteine O-methyltransferase Ste14